ncbi:MAG: xanthine dehydrogenase family protein molybdopterin-binding subunit [Deltaproteobacteria bacterium]|nr:xanthine dehydrogenase family protein molybdopterin-binding subunit [Deltaproteobacteria bacterium]
MENTEALRAGRYVGQSIKRKETYELFQGKTAYLSDIEVPGMAYAAISRSVYAHAKIKSVNLEKALKFPGVLAAFSGQDVKKLTKPMALFPFTQPRPYTSEYPRIRFFDHYCLAVDRVRHVGEAVAVVVATDRYVAADAVEEIEVEYEPLPVLTDVEEAMLDNAVRLYEDWANNIQYEFRLVEGPVDDLLRSSHLVIREKFVQHRYTGTPMETRGVIAHFEEGESLLTVWDSTQVPHSISNLVLDSLGRSDVKIRVICPAMGGGFGIKWAFYPEEVLIPLLSIQTNRPVAWWESRTEHMLASHHSREQVDYVEAGFDATGKITALKATVIVDMGVAYSSGGTSLSFVTSNYIPGPYKIENYSAVSYGVVTNKTPSGPLRANGKVESNFIMERVLDQAARELGIGRDEIRIRNFIQPHEFPYRSVTGSLYDSGDYPTCLRMALKAADYDRLLADQREARGNGRCRGIGIGFMMEPLSSLRPNAYNAGYETVMIRVDTVGKAWVFSGDINMGQAHKTTLSQIVADELGIKFEDVQVFEGDTALCTSASGSYASRYSTVTASAAILASRKIREKMLQIAAKALQCKPDELVAAGGVISDKENGARQVSVKAVANMAYYSINLLPEGMEPGLQAIHYFINPNTSFYPDEKGRTANFSTFPYAAHVAYVEVDERTGETKILKYLTVDDSGNMVNPMIIETQITGAIAHGLGGALLEELVYDEQGQLLSTNFMDYLIPSTTDMPEIEIHHMITPMPFTPGGFKGVGEIGSIGPPLVLASAVEDALSHLGIKIMRLPLKPEKIWREIQKAKGAVISKS